MRKLVAMHALTLLLSLSSSVGAFAPHLVGRANTDASLGYEG